MAANNKFQLPICWNDDIRMNALFTPFRSKSINPHNYDSKLEFWKCLILDYCKFQKGSPCFNKRELEKAFKRNEKSPYCLDTVIDEMIESKLITEQSGFLTSLTTFDSWTIWAFNIFFKNPIKWAYKKLVANVEKKDLPLTFIHLDLQKELSNNLYPMLQKLAGNVLLFEEVKNEVNDKIYLNDEGLRMCLFYLYLKRSIFLDFLINEEEITISLIKIPGKNSLDNKLTEVDRVLQKLKDTRNKLIDQLASIEIQLTLNQNEALKHIKEKNKKLARLSLKKKLLVQKNYEKKSDVLNNIETLITNIEDAESNSNILSSYKMGTQTLQSVMVSCGLSLDKVDDIVLTMKEVIDQQGEIQDSLINTDNDLNDTQLNEELEQLLLDKLVNENVPKNTILKNNNYEQDLIGTLSNLKVVSSIPTNNKEMVPN